MISILYNDIKNIINQTEVAAEINDKNLFIIYNTICSRSRPRTLKFGISGDRSNDGNSYVMQCWKNGICSKGAW